MSHDRCCRKEDVAPGLKQAAQFLHVLVGLLIKKADYDECLDLGVCHRGISCGVMIVGFGRSRRWSHYQRVHPRLTGSLRQAVPNSC
jgi:hypothetical protein